MSRRSAKPPKLRAVPLTPAGPNVVEVTNLIPDGTCLADFNASISGALGQYQRALVSGVDPDLAITVFIGGCNFASFRLATAVLGRWQTLAQTAAQMGAVLKLAPPPPEPEAPPPEPEAPKTKEGA